jgi:hypothetical protein
MEKTRIQDGKNSSPGSGMEKIRIRDRHPGSATLVTNDIVLIACPGAICAAPTALLAHGIGKGKRITSYPAFKDALSADYSYSEVRTLYINSFFLVADATLLEFFRSYTMV